MTVDERTKTIEEFMEKLLKKNKIVFERLDKI